MSCTGSRMESRGNGGASAGPAGGQGGGGVCGVVALSCISSGLTLLHLLRSNFLSLSGVRVRNKD